MPETNRMPVIDFDPKPPPARRGEPVSAPHGLCEFSIEANLKQSARLGRSFKSIAAGGQFPAGAHCFTERRGQGKVSRFVALLPLSHVARFLRGIADI